MNQIQRSDNRISWTQIFQLFDTFILNIPTMILLNHKSIQTIWICFLVFLFVAPAAESLRVIYRRYRSQVDKNIAIPKVHTGNIITAPAIVKKCPSGQLRDSRNKCRKVRLFSLNDEIQIYRRFFPYWVSNLYFFQIVPGW